MCLSETEATRLFLPPCKFRNLQRWKPQSMGVFFFLQIKYLFIAISTLNSPTQVSKASISCHRALLSMFF